MDVKGAILNLDTIRSLYGIIDSFDYSDGFLGGVDGFNLSPLNKFKDEFPDVIKALEFLDREIFFGQKLEGNHEFVIHFENDVAEMDCATFLTIDSTPFFIDIEVKDTDDISQLDEQFNLRETDSLVQLNFSDNYILIGFLENGFAKAIIKHANERIEVFDFTQLKVYFSKLTNESINLRLLLKDVESILKIQDVKNKIALHDFHLYSATRDAIQSIESNIFLGKRIIIIYGNAGSGKTVVALSLLYKYQEVKLLILNKNLYTVLALNQFYRNGTCFFGTNQYIDSLNSNSVAVIDECQRLSLNDINRIAKKAKTVVLLGDNNQAFTFSDSLLTEEELKTKLITNFGFEAEDISTKRMKKTARYNSRVNKLLEVLHNNSPIIGYANEVKEKVGDEFSIDVTMSETEFIGKYLGSSGLSRLYMPFSAKMEEVVNLSDKTFRVAGKDNVSFSIQNYYSTFVGNTYHAISFDVDNSFVILNNVGITKKDDFFFFYNKRDNPDVLTLDTLKKFNNQVNILFTRGRKSLHILTDDFYVYTYLNFKIKRGIR